MHFDDSFPLLRLFEFGDDFLVYDAKPHFAFIVEADELPILRAWLNTRNREEVLARHAGADRERLSLLLDGYEKMAARGVFLPGGLERLCSTDMGDLNRQLDYFFANVLMRKYVLEVTEDCNFRCRYCMNSMEENHRRHRPAHMSFDTARTAIDHYCGLYLSIYDQLNDDQKRFLLEEYEPHIGFYGGEPTLNFDVVRRGTEYFKTLDWGRPEITRDKTTVSLNTNLSRMNDEILNFLVDNDIQLFASLDGTRDQHDRNRIDAAGRGTFDIAYANLMRIRDFNANYYAQKVTVFAVDALGNDRTQNQAFLNALGCKHSLLDQALPDRVVDAPEASLKSLLENTDKSIRRKLEVIAAAGNSDAYIDELQALFSFENLGTDAPYGSNKTNRVISCPMGVDNIMIGVNGEMHICHKTDSSMPFGNVHTGLDREALIRLNLDYAKALNDSQCRECWAHNFCGICGAMRMKKGGFVNPLPKECDYLRAAAEFNFKLFIAVYRQRPEALEAIFRFKKDSKNHKTVVFADKLPKSPLNGRTPQTP